MVFEGDAQVEVLPRFTVPPLPRAGSYLWSHRGMPPAAAQSITLRQGCRLLKAGEEVLWHEEWEGAVEYTLFDGKGGVKTINFGQASTVGFLLSGTVRSMQIR